MNEIIDKRNETKKKKFLLRTLIQQHIGKHARFLARYVPQQYCKLIANKFALSV